MKYFILYVTSLIISYIVSFKYIQTKIKKHYPLYVMGEYTKNPLTISYAILNDHPDSENLIQWLFDNVKYKNNMAYWEYPEPMKKYKLKKGWYGAHMLGIVLSALCHYYKGEKRIIDLGEKILNTFNTQIKDGGVSDNGWFEEYPGSNSYILNGHITATLALYEFYKISNNSSAHHLFILGVGQVTYNLHKYDMGYWSKYELLFPYAASYQYHVNRHIPQLKKLYDITKDEYFREYYIKWKKYLKEPYFTIAKLRILWDAIDRRIRYKPFLRCISNHE